MKPEVYMILSNSGVCGHCGSYIYSGHRHDFISCQCGKVSVDGGLAYLRRVGDFVTFKDMSISVPREKYQDAFDYVNPMYEMDVEWQHNSMVVAVVLGMMAMLDPNKENAGEYSLAQAVDGLNWAKETGRNTLGIICAIARNYHKHPGKRWCDEEEVEEEDLPSNAYLLTELANSLNKIRQPEKS